jgi:hypothetical protein
MTQYRVASHHRTSMLNVGQQIEEGRHVGLDFYDLLIEALIEGFLSAIGILRQPSRPALHASTKVPWTTPKAMPLCCRAVLRKKSTRT